MPDTVQYLNTFVKLCRDLFELSNDGFLIVDHDCRIIYINSAYCRQLKVSQTHAVGRPVEEVVTNTDLPQMMKNRQHAPEIDISWRTIPHQYGSNEKFAILSRQIIYEPDTDAIIGAVGQVRFVRQTIQIAKEMQKLNDELDYLKNELNNKRVTFSSIIGTSKEIMMAKELAEKAAHSDFPILITGESGTGKEVFAKAIHSASPRRKNAFISLNCAAIPNELFESELFGYADGAFTGAKKGGKAGKLLLANHGTLFLDEIGEMPVNMQAKLLRALQEKEIEAVGGEMPVSVDIRIIAATNKDLKKEIHEGNFRLDLYYRLNIIELELPPLRRRQSDIMLLAQSFLDELNKRYSTGILFSNNVSSLLTSYDYPGNIRELRNLIERAYILSSDNKISAAQFPLSSSSITTLQKESIQSNETLADMLIDFKFSVVQNTLQTCGGSIKQCAAMLGIHRSSIYNIIAAYQKKHL